LRTIIEACAEFEDGLAVSPQSGAQTAELIASAVHASVMPDARTQATIALVSKTHATVRQYADAAKSAGCGSGPFLCLIGDTQREKQ
jgi:hypothetical protein